MKKVVSFIAFTALFALIGMFAFISAPLDSGSSAGAPVAIEANAPSQAPAAVMASGKFNGIAMPLANTGITNASSLLAEVNSTTGVTGTAALYYDPGLGFVTYDPTQVFPPPPNFAITTGMGLFVQAQGSLADTFTVVGDVPAQGAVDFSLTGNTPCVDNYLSIPLDQTALEGAQASDLLASIGVSASLARYYDPDLGFITYDPSQVFPPPPNFTVRIGYPYFVCMTANQIWP